MLKGEITIFVYSIFIFLNFNEKILFQFCSLKKNYKISNICYKIEINYLKIGFIINKIARCTLDVYIVKKYMSNFHANDAIIFFKNLYLQFSTLINFYRIECNV